MVLSQLYGCSIFLTGGAIKIIVLKMEVYFTSTYNLFYNAKLNKLFLKKNIILWFILNNILEM